MIKNGFAIASAFAMTAITVLLAADFWARAPF